MLLEAVHTMGFAQYVMSHLSYLFTQGRRAPNIPSFKKFVYV